MTSDTASATRLRPVGRSVTLIAGLLAGSCGGVAGPAALDPANDQCAHCRMAVSDRHFAAQIAAPGEEPLFFDDIGCLRDYVTAHQTLPPDALAWVADHRTTDWVPAAEAIYTRAVNLRTPMNSGLIAHADRASRDGDRAAAGGHPVPADEIVGPPSAVPRRGR